MHGSSKREEGPVNGALANAFRRDGRPREAGGNAPLLLEDPDEVWWVEEGRVDVFAVDVVDDRAQGPRDYLFTVEEGRLLFGMEPPWAAEMGLLAVGNVGTRVRGLSMERFRTLADQDPEGAARLVEAYVEAFSGAVARRSHPRFDVLAVAGESVELHPSKAVAPSRGVVWLSVEEGYGLFDGFPELQVRPEDGPFPLGNGAWLLAPEGMKAGVRSADEVLGREAIWSGFRNFRRIALEWAAEILEKDRREEELRLGRRMEARREAGERALEHLAGVMDPEAVPPPSKEGDELFRACELVGRAAHIELEPAPEWDHGRGLMDELRALARASRVGHRRVALTDGWWEEENGPLLGFLAPDGDEGDPTPVALLPGDDGEYEMVDPAEGSRTPVDRDVHLTLEPFGYTFYRPLPSRELSPGDLWSFVARGVGGDVRTVVALGVAGAALGLLTPILTGFLFDMVIPSADRLQLVHLFLALVVAAVASAAFRITRSIAVVRLRNRVQPDLQMAVLDRLIRLPLPFFRRYSAGDLALRARGVSEIGEALGGATISSILGAIVGAGAFGLLFIYSVPLALVATAVLVVTAVFTAFTAHTTLRYERELQEVEGKLSGLVLQFLNGIAKLRVSGTESRAFAEWARDFRRQRELRFRVGGYNIRIQVWDSVMSIVSLLAIFGFYTLLADDPSWALTTGDFLAFNAAFGIFMSSGMSLTQTAIRLMELVPTWERARPILEAAPEVSASKPDPGELTGHIEVSHLSFAYDEDGPLILDDVSFEAQPGEFIALVGPSGAGKSTLLRVLLGFEMPETSSVYYDEHDLATVDVSAVRRQIGVVLQSSSLTAGDIFTNIVGASSLTVDDAWEAARMAGLEDDLDEMPMGLHTVISEGGGTLSGGQKQRLLIARALVHKPRILFFDEATSALDNRAQETVTESLDRLHATRIVIAHRLSTIRGADRIYVLERGRVAEFGTFEDLMAREGLFAELAARQEA